MSSRNSQLAKRQALIIRCLIMLALAIAVFAAGTAKAAQYKVLLCAAGVGSNAYGTSTNTASPQNPGGIFSFENYCGPGSSDPAGNSALLRIAENQPSGNAGYGAYGNIYYDSPAYVHFKTGGGYTRQFNAFADGWRARFWVASLCCTAQIMTQGNGAQWASTGVFTPHLWEPSFQYDFTRFTYEMQCVRSAGCNRENFNATDLNTLTFVVEDDFNSQVALTDGSPMMSGAWVRGTQTATFQWAELGSGIRFERIRIDGADRWWIDHQATGECNTGASQASGEFGRVFQPCATSPHIGRAYTFDTSGLGDGAHTLQACTQDYGQWRGLNGTGSESCDQRTIRTDNSAPGAPSGLLVASANPQRYLDRFGASFGLPPNQGSPITKVHYNIIDAAGSVIVPEKVLSSTNPTELVNIAGPSQTGDYRLQVWLEDEVGLVGPASRAPIPRDTTPPAAPQGLSVTAPGVTRAEQGFDLRWRNLTDSGSPIDAAHYQVLDAAGKVVVPTQSLSGHGIESVANLDAPKGRGAFSLRLWLSDSEHNVGAPVTAPLTYDCVRSEVGGGTLLGAGLGANGVPSEVIDQGQGSILGGQLRGGEGGVVGASLCVFATVVTDSERAFLGIALTGPSGGYQFPVAPGPSRTLGVIYRPDQRQLAASARTETRVRPTLRVRRKVVHNKRTAHFSGELPGPHSDDVVVVLQAKSGKGWRAFRRYRTRAGGRFEMRYRFNRTTTPTTYVMRAQVRSQSGYPYVEGSSQPVSVRVLP